jgi:hypothetical protein
MKNDNIPIRWKDDKEPDDKNCNFCGKPARWRRPYIQPTSPHVQTYWLTLCEKCDKHQRESNQRLMARLGYQVIFHPGTFKHRVRSFYL